MSKGIHIAKRGVRLSIASILFKGLPDAGDPLKWRLRHAIWKRIDRELRPLGKTREDLAELHEKPKQPIAPLDTLFPDMPVMKSPRLEWIESHGVLCHYSPAMSHADPSRCWLALIPREEHRGMELADIIRHHGFQYDCDKLIGYGRREDEALADMAVKLNLKLWNQS